MLKSWTKLAAKSKILWKIRINTANLRLCEDAAGPDMMRMDVLKFILIDLHEYKHYNTKF